MIVSEFLDGSEALGKSLSNRSLSFHLKDGLLTFEHAQTFGAALICQLQVCSVSKGQIRSTHKSLGVMGH